MTNTQNAARERRTTALLAAFRGNPHEFLMLKGVLCMDIGTTCPEDQAYLGLAFNLVRIAERMDAINAEARAEGWICVPTVAHPVLHPTDRIKAAQICQGGASNERKVAQCLVEAIDQCRAAQIDPRKDAATYLILHQLVHLLTGHDVQPASEMGKDWLQCTVEVGA